MARLHLFEFQDLKWFPGFLRDYITDFLQFLSNISKLYKPIIPLIEKGIESSGNRLIFDIGSGGGGGLLWLNTELKKKYPDIKILLSDYYPNINAFEYTKKKADNFDYFPEAIDARNVPTDPKGLRTIFLLFHHFRPADASRILQNAVDSKNAIAIFEPQQRTLPSIVAMLSSPFIVLAVTPFVRPFKFGRLFFTYIIPIVPICACWEGIASSLRTYSLKEMKMLVDGISNKDTYNWEIGKLSRGLKVFYYLLGTEKLN